MQQESHQFELVSLAFCDLDDTDDTLVVAEKEKSTFEAESAPFDHFWTRNRETSPESLIEVAMRIVFSVLLLLTVGISPFSVQDHQTMAQTNSADEISKTEPLAHIVFFTLAELNEENRSKLIEACKKYLDKHDGVIYFGVGVNAPEYNREVNDRDYDVALHLVFETAAHQDAYQTHPRHVQFVEECKSLWKKVRVFDSRLK